VAHDVQTADDRNACCRGRIRHFARIACADIGPFSTRGAPVDLYFGPAAPAGHESRWIKTAPGKGWFTYIRIFGPEQAAFDQSCKSGDFVEVK
jgi:hypothetical protein